MDDGLLDGPKNWVRNYGIYLGLEHRVVVRLSACRTIYHKRHFCEIERWVSGSLVVSGVSTVFLSYVVMYIPKYLGTYLVSVSTNGRNSFVDCVSPGGVSLVTRCGSREFPLISQ